MGWLDSSRARQGGDSSVLNPVTQLRHLERASPLASAVILVPLPEDQLRQQEGLCACAVACAPCAATPLQLRPCPGLRALSSWPCWVGVGGGLPRLGRVDSRGRVGCRRRLCVLLHEMRTPLRQFSETLALSFISATAPDPVHTCFLLLWTSLPARVWYQPFVSRWGSVSSSRKVFLSTCVLFDNRTDT